MKVKIFDKLIYKVTRRPNETKQECINRGVPLLISEGLTPEQARAAAENMCDLRKTDDGVSKRFWKGVLGILK